ncbi:hypothetical protein [Nonomuraea sp. NPDC049400]|uniref:hypothetical protein n=1 Tax=Nonomuraea sp. NPDC049400 TaxID=3364352 RepID=UPI00378935F2
MSPDQTADKTAALLGDASAHLLDNAYVQPCVAVADAWMRLHLTLGTGERYAPHPSRCPTMS